MYLAEQLQIELMPGQHALLLEQPIRLMKATLMFLQLD